MSEFAARRLDARNIGSTIGFTDPEGGGVVFGTIESIVRTDNEVHVALSGHEELHLHLDPEDTVDITLTPLAHFAKEAAGVAKEGIALLEELVDATIAHFDRQHQKPPIVIDAVLVSEPAEVEQ